MGLSDKMFNSTPWEAQIPYSRVKIIIPGDSFARLTPEQVDDFRSGKPGSEEVRRLLQSFGCFMYDTDKSHDIQMLDCLKACVKEKEMTFSDYVNNVRNQRIAAGQSVVSEDDLEGMISMGGYNVMREQIITLKARITKLEGALRKTGEIGRTAPKYNPEQTCFGVSPPKEFASALQLQMYLDENPEVAAKDQEFRTRAKIEAA